MLTLSQADLVGFAIERAGALQVFWNFYLVVATAILAAMASGKTFTATLQFKTLISGAFIAFAGSNYLGMSKLAETRRALLNIAEFKDPALTDLRSSLQPLTTGELIGFHLLVDCIVLACVWFIAWPNTSAAR